jgi:hypothetical protein
VYVLCGRAAETPEAATREFCDLHQLTELDTTGEIFATIVAKLRERLAEENSKRAAAEQAARDAEEAARAAELVRQQQAAAAAAAAAAEQQRQAALKASPPHPLGDLIVEVLVELGDSGTLLPLEVREHDSIIAAATEFVNAHNFPQENTLPLIKVIFLSGSPPWLQFHVPCDTTSRCFSAHMCVRFWSSFLRSTVSSACCCCLVDDSTQACRSRQDAAPVGRASHG